MNVIGILCNVADQLFLGGKAGIGMGMDGAEHCILIARLIVEMLFDAAMGFI
jgi:hypothetical protein